MNNKELVQRIKTEIDRFVEDQQQPKPFFQPGQISAELHGFFADLLYVEKVNDELLVNFLIGLFNANKKPSKDEIAQLLEAVSYSFSTMV